MLWLAFVPTCSEIALSLDLFCARMDSLKLSRTALALFCTWPFVFVTEIVTPEIWFVTPEPAARIVRAFFSSAVATVSPAMSLPM